MNEIGGLFDTWFSNERITWNTRILCRSPMRVRVTVIVGKDI